MNYVAQLDTGRPSKIGVSAKHFDGKGNFVNDALAGRLHLYPKFQVFRHVVESITVFVVYVLAFAERASQYLFHKDAVLVSFFTGTQMQSTVSCRMDVAVLVNRTARTSFVATFHRAKTLCLIVAGVATVFCTAKTALSDFTTKLALKHWRRAAVHAASLALLAVLVKEIV